MGGRRMNGRRGTEMKANEARTIAERARDRKPSIQPWLNAIYRDISSAAGSGDRQIINPFTGKRMPAPEAEVRDRIYEQLRLDG
jgi:hypothetical protein